MLFRTKRANEIERKYLKKLNKSRFFNMKKNRECIT